MNSSTSEPPAAGLRRPSTAPTALAADVTAASADAKDILHVECAGMKGLRLSCRDQREAKNACHGSDAAIFKL